MHTFSINYIHEIFLIKTRVCQILHVNLMNTIYGPASKVPHNEDTIYSTCAMSPAAARPVIAFVHRLLYIHWTIVTEHFTQYRIMLTTQSQRATYSSWKKLSLQQEPRAHASSKSNCLDIIYINPRVIVSAFLSWNRGLTLGLSAHCAPHDH
jgi:hypothetical protein